MHRPHSQPSVSPRFRQIEPALAPEPDRAASKSDFVIAIWEILDIGSVDVRVFRDGEIAGLDDSDCGDPAHSLAAMRAAFREEQPFCLIFIVPLPVLAAKKLESRPQAAPQVLGSLDCALNLSVLLPGGSSRNCSPSSHSSLQYTVGSEQYRDPTRGARLSA
jgi:hypothetical protein